MPPLNEDGREMPGLQAGAAVQRVDPITSALNGFKNAKTGFDRAAGEVTTSEEAVNAARAEMALRHLIPRLAGMGVCACQSALSNAIVTRLELAPKETLERLGPLVTKYMPQDEALGAS